MASPQLLLLFGRSCVAVFEKAAAAPAAPVAVTERAAGDSALQLHAFVEAVCMGVACPGGLNAVRSMVEDVWDFNTCVVAGGDLCRNAVVFGM